MSTPSRRQARSALDDSGRLSLDSGRSICASGVPELYSRRSPPIPLAREARAASTSNPAVTWDRSRPTRDHAPLQRRRRRRPWQTPANAGRGVFLGVHSARADARFAVFLPARRRGTATAALVRSQIVRTIRLFPAFKAFRLRSRAGQSTLLRTQPKPCHRAPFEVFSITQLPADA